VPTISPGALRTPPSGIRRIFELSRAQPGEVLELHVGEPSFPPPPHVVAAAQRGYADGRTRYTANAGLPELRAALAADLTARQGVATAPSQVVVTAGGMQALHLALALTAAPGDEVLVPDPGWPNFAMAVELLGATPVRYPLPPERGFRPDPAALAALVTERTTALVVNTPSNPLGSVLPAEEVEALVRLADAADLWLLSDECYDALVFDGAEHTSARRYDTAGRVVGVHSFSKTYAMTGVRVGWLVAPEPFAAQAAKVQEAVVSCVNEPAQLGAVAALTGPQDAVRAARDSYAARRDAATALLDAAGVAYLPPGGAFYLWVDVRRFCAGDVTAWAERMVVERGVAVAPGTAFGEVGEGWVRVSLASATEDLLEGLRRLTA
jgi:aspartate aminotransferase